MTPEIKDLLERLKEYMSDRSDADEGHPNAEMQFEMEIDLVLARFDEGSFLRHIKGSRVWENGHPRLK
jgi:hypothetical protein